MINPPINSTRRIRCRGSSLVEVMLAAALLFMMLAMAVTSLMYPTLLIVSDSRRQIALFEAGQCMEQMAASSYDEISATNYTITAINKPISITRSVLEGDDEKTITIQAHQTENNLLLVELVTQRTY